MLEGENRCGTCKHWRLLTIAEAGKVGVEGAGNEGYCDRIQGVPNVYAVDVPNGELAAANANYSETRVWFATRAEFGCVLWERKAVTA